MPPAVGPTSPPGSSRRSLRRWCFRLLAVGLGILPFVLLEFALRAAGLPHLPPPADPYVDLHHLRPLFEPNAATGRMEIGAQRMDLFRPAAFAMPKPPNTFRVFALGGSTTQGEPYSTETAFPEWLRLNLQAAAGQRQVEVINCGGLSYASYRVLAILREVLAYAPDLIVVYTGQNEYLEYRTYAGYRQVSPWQEWLAHLADLKTVQLARSFAGQAAVRDGGEDSGGHRQRTVLQTEVDALLDYQGGLADYQRGAAWYGPIPDHFRWNLEQMVTATRKAGVPLLLVRPVSNLLDCPPFKFEIAPNLTAQQRHDFEQQWDAARRPAQSSDVTRDHLQQALAIDPQHAGALYALGQLQVAAGEYAAALENLRAAKDNDVCPLRAPTAICQAVSQVARQHAIPLVDAENLFASRSPHGLVGNRWLVDHVHPNLEGHQLLGEALAECCFEHGLYPAPQGPWTERRRELYTAHLEGLSEAYFHRGKQRLEGLLLWTQGRARKTKAAGGQPP